MSGGGLVYIIPLLLVDASGGHSVLVLGARGWGAAQPLTPQQGFCSSLCLSASLLLAVLEPQGSSGHLQPGSGSEALRGTRTRQRVAKFCRLTMPLTGYHVISGKWADFSEVPFSSL